MIRNEKSVIDAIKFLESQPLNQKIIKSDSLKGLKPHMPSAPDKIHELTAFK